MLTTISQRRKPLRTIFKICYTSGKNFKNNLQSVPKRWHKSMEFYCACLNNFSYILITFWRNISVCNKASDDQNTVHLRKYPLLPSLMYSQYTSPTPTRLNCRVASRRWCVHEFATSSRRLPTDSVDNIGNWSLILHSGLTTWILIDIDNFFTPRALRS